MDHDLGLAALIGALLPLIVALAIQPTWPPAARSGATLGIAVIASVATSFLSDGVSLSDPAFDWVAWVGTIWGAAVVSYRNLWKPTEVAPRIEAASSPKPNVNLRE